MATDDRSVTSPDPEHKQREPADAEEKSSKDKGKKKKDKAAAKDKAKSADGSPRADDTQPEGSHYDAAPEPKSKDKDKDKSTKKASKDQQKADKKKNKKGEVDSEDEDELAAKKNRSKVSSPAASTKKSAGTDSPRGSKTDDASSSAASASASASSSSAPAIDSASDSVFSQLLLESILEQRSVADFIGGLPDKRGVLLVRFPTTLLGKSWKKRYFTLHGDNLYFHEDQSVIHPTNVASASGTSMLSLASTSKDGMGSGKSMQVQTVNYEKCKKIDIANYWIIQQDATSAAAAGGGNAGNEKIYGGGQPIPSDDASVSSSGPSDSVPKLSKFDEMFKAKNKDAKGSKDSPRGGDKDSSSSKDAKKEKDKEDKGPVVRGRRRSSLVAEKGSTVILLMSKEKEDPMELTGLNEGSMADLSTLNEWVLAINARICLLNFLHSPLHLTAMARGGREILAFLTDASATHLRIQNKFTDLTAVLQHFRDPLSHRKSVSFTFENCAMTDSALGALCDILISNPNMQVPRLNLSRNLLTKAGMGALHRALKINTHIGELILDQNQIGDEGIERLLSGERTMMSPDPAAAPQSIWSYGMDLHSLSFGANQLSDRSVESFVHSLVTHLNHVNKTAEADSDEEEVAATPKSTSSAENSNFNHTFKAISFAGNQVTDAGVHLLSAFFRRHPCVVLEGMLGLKSNFLTDVSATSLGELLASECCKLESLDLAENQLTSAGLSTLVSSLAANPEQRHVWLDMGANPGIDAQGLQQLMGLRTKSGVWAVNVTSLAFSVFDPEVIAARSQGGAAVPGASPKAATPSAARSNVASISTSQQNVLNLFSPTQQPQQHHGLPQYPAVSSAKVSPTTPVLALTRSGSAGSASSSTVSSANSSPSSATRKADAPMHPPKKKDKNSRENDPSAPRIAIAPHATATPKLAIQPLHPPPAFQQPIASPDAQAGQPGFMSPAGVAVAAAVGAGTPGVGGPTPGAADDEEEHPPQSLLPTQKGEKKPKGVAP